MFLYSLFLVLGVSAQESFSEKKSMTKVYPLDAKASLEVENKYGDIIFETWEKDSVRIDVSILVEAKKPDVVDQLIEMAVVEIEKKGTFIIARTDWGKNTSFWNKSLNEISRAFGSDQKIQIDYKIFCPASLSIDIENKFGDVFLPAYTGEVIMDVSHGDLRCRNMQNPKNVKLSYGKALLDKLNEGMVTLEFAQLRTKSAKNISVYSRSSEIYIDSADKLTIDSRNDDLFLGQIKELNGDLHFSTCEIDELGNSADLNQEYGALTVKELSDNFTTVKIAPKRSEVTFYTAREMNYNFSVFLKNGEEFASVPELINITTDEKLDDGRLIEGSWGHSNPGQKLIIQGESSVIKIAKL